MSLAQFSWRDRYGEKNEPEKGAAMHIFVGERVRRYDYRLSPMAKVLAAVKCLPFIIYFCPLGRFLTYTFNIDSYGAG